MLEVVSNAENSFKGDFAKVVQAAFGGYGFVNILTFSWYQALYSASSSTFPHLDFTREFQ